MKKKKHKNSKYNFLMKKKIKIELQCPIADILPVHETLLHVSTMTFDNKPAVLNCTLLLFLIFMLLS